MNSWRTDGQIIAKASGISKKIFPNGFNIKQMIEVGRAIHDGYHEDEITAEFINGMVELTSSVAESGSEANNE